MEYYLYLSIIAVLGILTTVASFRYQRVKSLIFGLIAILFSRTIVLAGASPLYWHDSYFYMSVSTAIDQTGSYLFAESTIQWYNATGLAKWPTTQTYTVILSDMTGFSLETLKILIPPILAGLLFVTATYWIGEVVTKRSAAPAALLLVMLDPFFRYLTQYHAQGAGILFLTLVLAVIVFYNRRPTPGIFLTLIAVVLMFAATHRFTSIFIILVFSLATAIQLLLFRLSQPNINRQFIGAFAIIIILTTYHIFVDPSFLKSVMLNVFKTSTTPPTTGGVVSDGGLYSQLGLAIKPILLVLTAPSIYLTLRNRTELQWHLTVLASAGLIGIPIGLIAGAATARVILIGYLMMLPFVAQTLDTILEFESLSPRARHSVVSLVLCCVVIMGVIAGAVPSFVDHGADLQNDGYDDSYPISEQQAVQAGEFLDAYNKGPIYVSFWTRMVATYYGGFNLADIDYPQISPDGDGIYDSTSQTRPFRDSVIYRNGGILIRTCDNNVTCETGRRNR